MRVLRQNVCEMTLATEMQRNRDIYVWKVGFNATFLDKWMMIWPLNHFKHILPNEWFYAFEIDMKSLRLLATWEWECHCLWYNESCNASTFNV